VEEGGGWRDNRNKRKEGNWRNDKQNKKKLKTKKKQEGTTGAFDLFLIRKKPNTQQQKSW